jgi:protein-S-isoprenylcysteine O-methyltransferase Ste14
MNDLNKKAFGGVFISIVILGICLFLPAWTLDYWQAWIFLCIFSLSILAITLYLMKKDPKLLARRMKANPSDETERNQKILHYIARLAFIGLFILSGTDHRFGWSFIPVYMVLAGDLLIALGLLIIFFVFKENSFASTTVQVTGDQKIISTGPYAIVRHPMYTGAFIMLLGIPLSLGSWWSFIMVILFIVVIIWRLLEEEIFLSKNLPGYPVYINKVRYRLLPQIW